MPEELQRRSLLLLTRFDKLTDESDRARVLSRMKKEAGDQFRAIFPISLLEAMAAEDDRELWNASGAEAFTQALLDLILELDGRIPGPDADAQPTLPGTAPQGDVISIPTPAPESDDSGIAPRRVSRPKRASSMRPRPTG